MKWYGVVGTLLFLLMVVLVTAAVVHFPKVILLLIVSVFLGFTVTMVYQGCCDIYENKYKNEDGLEIKHDE